MRESFVFYRSFYNSMRYMDPEMFKETFTAVVEYALDGKEPETTNPFSLMAFELIKPQIDANNKRFENGCKGAEFGKKGGAPKGNQNARKTTPKQPLDNPKTTPKNNQNNPKTTPNVNVNDNVNVNVNDNVNNNTNNILNNNISIDVLERYSPLNPPSLNNAFKDYLITLESQNKTFTNADIEKWKRALVSYSKDPEEQIAIVNQSKDNGWFGMFPLKRKPTVKSETDEWLDMIRKAEMKNE